MASLMENLIMILDQENSEYELLVALSGQKTPAIVQGNLELLTKITEDEQVVVSKINKLERDREETIRDIASVINKDVNTLKLTNLIQMLGSRPEEQKQLAIVHERLRQTTKMMSDLNEHNKLLIQNALEMVEFDVNLLQAMKQAPETANYNKGAYSTGSTFANGYACFDAKQ